MLTIRDTQLLALQAVEQTQFDADMIAHLRRFYPVDHALLGADGLLAVIHAGQAEAMSHGLGSAGEVRRFIDLGLVLGSGFLRDPLLPWAARCLAQDRPDAGAIANLCAQAVDYLDLVNGADGLQALRAVLRASGAPFADLTDVRGAPSDSILRLLRRVWPEKFRCLPVALRPAFLRAATVSARRVGLAEPAACQFHALMMFLLGAEYTTDPALPWAGAALAGSVGLPPLARAHAVYDAGLSAVVALRPLLPRQGA